MRRIFLAALIYTFACKAFALAWDDPYVDFDNELYKMDLAGEWKRNLAPWDNDKENWQWIGSNGETMNIEWGRIKGKWPSEILEELIKERHKQAAAEIDSLKRKFRVEDLPAVKTYQPKSSIYYLTTINEDGSLRGTYLIIRNHVHIRLAINFKRSIKAAVQRNVIFALSNISWREPLDGALETKEH